MEGTMAVEPTRQERLSKGVISRKLLIVERLVLRLFCFEVLGSVSVVIQFRSMLLAFLLVGFFLYCS